MSSRDPWHGIPNLSGVSAPVQEDGRSGDPSRFYPSMRGGVIDAVTGRILDTPRAYVHLSNEVPHTAGAVSDATYVAGGVAFDNDGMAKASPFITCVTPGWYEVSAFVGWAGGGGVAKIWTRIPINSNLSNTVSQATENRDQTVWGVHLPLGGPWLAQTGDKISLSLYSDVAVNVTDMFLAAILRAPVGSDSL